MKMNIGKNMKNIDRKIYKVTIDTFSLYDFENMTIDEAILKLKNLKHDNKNKYDKLTFEVVESSYSDQRLLALCGHKAESKIQYNIRRAKEYELEIQKQEAHEKYELEEYKRLKEKYEKS